MKNKALLILLLLLVCNWGFTKGLPDSSRLVSYFDGIIQAHMDDEHIAGATVSMVKDGKLYFAKGYGYSDLEKEIPVDPEKTLFRIGSVSKLFVWTAVMQLYEQGKLDLNTDVNEYLTEFKIPEKYGKPITLKNIMTHSAGFEEYILGLFAKDSAKLEPLGKILNEQMPARVRPPGSYSSYSNHATSIAAYIVEQVSGQSFNDYVEENIFNPLSMTRSTFRQPIPETIDATMSKGYKYSGGEFVEKSFEYVPLYPVGGASSTATDMAKFMIAHLQDGKYKDQSIMDSTTSQFMQSVAFRHDPEVNPMRYGFMDMSQNKVEIIGHGGDTFWFHTLFAFFPEKKMGLFISFNSQGGGGTYSRVLKEFVDQFYPEKLENPEFSIDKEELEKFEGSYRGNRFPQTRFTKVAALMGHTKVTATDDGKLKIENSNVEYYIPAGKLTFRNEDNSNTLVFREDSEGSITHMFKDLSPIVAYEKLKTTETSSFHQTIFSLSAVIFLITLLYWPIAYFIRREYKQPITTHLSLRVKLTGWTASFSFILALLLIMAATSSENEIVFGVPALLKVALIFPIIGTILTIITIYQLYKLWAVRKPNWSGIIHFTLLVVAFLFTVWQFNYWNLLGFQY